MKRFACVAAVCLAATFGPGASSARAQVLPPPDASRFSVEVNFGPTLGHQSSWFYGVDGGFRLVGGLHVFIEGGHMDNVGTSDLDDRAAVIANYLGGTATTAFKVNHGDVGLRYDFTASPKVRPYVLGAVGVAAVKTEAEFTVNGAVVDPATKGVQLGSDLSGSHNSTLLVFGFGVQVPFGGKAFGDFGYRYGQILANEEAFEAIPTQRVVFGVGVRF
jgi:opacity protein-like surface antigen